MKELLESLYQKHKEELKHNNFSDGKIIVWTKDKVLFGKVNGSDVEFKTGISDLKTNEILEFRLFDGKKELYFWGDCSRVYIFLTDEEKEKIKNQELKEKEINSHTIMLGKVVECENSWSKVDDGRGGKFYLPLDKKDGEIIIEKCDIIGYHKETHQAYIKGYAIKEIK